MVTDRPYRKRLSLEQAKEELRKGAGKQFDPNAIDAFLTLLTQKETKTAPASTPIV
jgi:HD-GYP domain-containing protein (c-di-GMP phosphodiesterase class II)